MCDLSRPSEKVSGRSSRGLAVARVAAVQVIAGVQAVLICAGLAGSRSAASKSSTPFELAALANPVVHAVRTLSPSADQ